MQRQIAPPTILLRIRRRSWVAYEELTRSATREEAGEVAGKNLDLYLCANRTCEVGMEHATHAPYESFVYALEELTRER